jgi:hypothetical protein
MQSGHIFEENEAFNNKNKNMFLDNLHQDTQSQNSSKPNN